jgi:hypothetical protein
MRNVQGDAIMTNFFSIGQINPATTNYGLHEIQETQIKDKQLEMI